MNVLLASIIGNKPISSIFLGSGIILSMPGQAVLFSTSVAAGAIVGALYDIFRIMRKTMKHPRLIIQLEDLLFWLTGTALIFYYLLHASSGELRVYILFGVIIGAYFYFITLSRLILRSSDLIIMAIKTVLKKITDILFYPFRLIWSIITHFTRKIWHSLNFYTHLKMRRAKRNWKIIRKKI
jgi:spore cortex biosynthesis protein YabQ